MADLKDSGRHHLPDNVIVGLDERDIFKTFEERTDERLNIKRAAVIDGNELKPGQVQAMEWPMLDDGRKLGTNAYGYPTGGWYALQKRKLEEEKEAQRAEEERKAREEAEAQEAAEREHLLTVEEIEQLREQARQDGLAEGLAQGQEQGYKEGFARGEAEGLEQGRNEGHEQGFAKGLAEGREQGFAKGQQQGIAEGTAIVSAQAERFRHLADMLANPLRDLDRDVTDEIIYIISRLCRVILKHELKGDADFLRRSVEHAASLLPNAKQGAVIRLNEEDLGLVEAAFGREYLKEAHWDLVADPKLAPGDVEAENPASTVSWRVDERVDALLNDFLIQSAPAVAQALRENIEGAPEAGVAPLKPLAPPPKLADFKESIEKSLQQTAAGAPASAAGSADPAAKAQAGQAAILPAAGTAAAGNGAAENTVPKEKTVPAESPAMAARRRARAAAQAKAQAATAIADGLPEVADNPFASMAP